MDHRERKALKALSSGFIEPPNKISGVGSSTWESLKDKGWVEWIKCDEYVEEGYKITSAGEHAFYGD